MTDPRIDLQLQIFLTHLRIIMHRCEVSVEGENKAWLETIATVLLYGAIDLDMPTVTNLWRASIIALPDKNGLVAKLALESDEVINALELRRK